LNYALFYSRGTYIWVINISCVDPDVPVGRAGVDKGAIFDAKDTTAGAVTDAAVALVDFENTTGVIGVLVAALVGDIATDALLEGAIPTIPLDVPDNEILDPDWIVGMVAVPVGPRGMEATTLWELDTELVLELNGSSTTFILCQLPLLSVY